MTVSSQPFGGNVLSRLLSMSKRFRPAQWPDLKRKPPKIPTNNMRKHTMPFSTLGLSPQILRALQESGYSEPTPVQQKVIPLVLEERDVMARAQTGSGKSASFVLPVLGWY